MRAAALMLVAACATEPPIDAASDPRGPTLSATAQEMSVCADGPTVYGIDVSRFQGAIDWQQVADSGVVYAFIQISRSLTDIDARFEENWRGAKQVGILRGAYQRFQPDQDVIGQAQLFLDKLGPFQLGDLPPMLDVEDDGGLAPAEIAQKVRQWIDYVEPRVGVRPILYTGYYFWRDQVGGADFSAYPLWIANYGATCPLVPPAWTRWTLHQYSSTARIPGITANTVDVNKFNGTLDELVALGRMAECGDGTCNGEETPDSCAADCPPCQLIAAGGGVIDDTSPCFHAGGASQSIRHENAGYGSSLQWTYASAAPEPDNYAVWDLHFAEAGRYRIEAFTPAPHNQSRRAVYRVTHGSTTTEVPVDQQAVDGWNLIGELEFAAGGAGQSVRLDDNTGEPVDTQTQLVFDALRVTRLDGPTSEGSEGDSGCAAAGAGAGAAWLAIALGVVIRRRRTRRGGADRRGGAPCARPRGRGCT